MEFSSQIWKWLQGWRKVDDGKSKNVLEQNPQKVVEFGESEANDSALGSRSEPLS